MERSPVTQISGIGQFNELTREERAVIQAIRGTSYGAVEVVVHQTRIVQILKTEKVCLEGTQHQA